MQKTIILLRHAHREKKSPEQDNGLSDKGRDQRVALLQFFKTRFSNLFNQKNSAFVALSSPKKRCRETLEVLTSSFGEKLKIDESLDERLFQESFEDYNQRVHQSINRILEIESPLVILCSHGDWLPVATFHLLGQPISMKKGAWLELEWDGKECHISWLIQKFKFYNQCS